MTIKSITTNQRTLVPVAGEALVAGPPGPAGPTGPAGATGPAGTAGTPGSDGNTIWNGIGAPVGVIGAQAGDFYIDTSALTIYGPMNVFGAWGAGTSLVQTNASLLTSGTLPAGRLPAFVGDVTGVAGANALTIANHAVTNSKIRQGAAFSVIGVTGNALADVADIAGTAGQILRVNLAGTSLGFGAISLATSASVVGILQDACFPALTGDVTTVAGAVATTIASHAVTNAKFRQGAALSVVGVTGNALADVADIAGTANQVLRVNSGGTALGFGAINLAAAAAVTGILLAGSFPALTGDVTTSAGALATTIAANAVTDSKFRQGAGMSVVGVTGNATANVADIIAGAANQVMRANTAGTGIGFGAVNLASSNAVTGTLLTASFPALTGDVTNSAGSLATTVGKVQGITYPASPYVIGDILYASSTSAMSRLADVATGSVLVSGGVGAAPAWSATPQLSALGINTAAVSNQKLNITGTDGEITGVFIGGATSGQSYGPQIIAGSTSADNAFIINNRANSLTLFRVRGDGLLNNRYGALGTTLLTVLTASSSANLTYTLPTSGFDDYLIVLENIVPATNGANLLLRYSTDGSTYITTNYIDVAGGTDSIRLGTAVNSFGTAGFSGIVNIAGMSRTDNVKFASGSVGLYNSSSAVVAQAVSGFYNGASSAILAIQFLFSGGNITSGKIRIYGMASATS